MDLKKIISIHNINKAKPGEYYYFGNSLDELKTRIDSTENPLLLRGVTDDGFFIPEGELQDYGEFLYPSSCAYFIGNEDYFFDYTKASLLFIGNKYIFTKNVFELNKIWESPYEKWTLIDINITQPSRVFKAKSPEGKVEEFACAYIPSNMRNQNRDSDFLTEIKKLLKCPWVKSQEGTYHLVTFINKKEKTFEIGGVDTPVSFDIYKKSYTPISDIQKDQNKTFLSDVADIADETL